MNPYSSTRNIYYIITNCYISDVKFQFFFSPGKWSSDRKERKKNVRIQITHRFCRDRGMTMKKNNNNNKSVWYINMAILFSI